MNTNIDDVNRILDSIPKLRRRLIIQPWLSMWYVAEIKEHRFLWWRWVTYAPVDESLYCWPHQAQAALMKMNAGKL